MDRSVRILFVDDTKLNVDAVKDLGWAVETQHLEEGQYGNLEVIKQFTEDFIKSGGKTLILLDFDQTLVRRHSGGFPDIAKLQETGELFNLEGEPVSTSDELGKINRFLKDLMSQPGVEVGIVSRGREDLIQQVINYILEIK